MTDLRERQLAALRGMPGALVLVDAQHDFAAPEVIGDWCEPGQLDKVQQAVATMVALVDAARASGVPVVWVELATSQMSWTSDNWFRNGSRDIPMGESRPCLDGTPGAEWYGGLTPAPGEIRVKKDAYSGFIGTDLEAQLKAAGFEWLVIGGLTTECCVLSTANDAMQHDWLVLVPEDACAAYSAYHHRAGLDLLALNSSLITDAAEVTGLFASFRPEAA